MSSHPRYILKVSSLKIYSHFDIEKRIKIIVLVSDHLKTLQVQNIGLSIPTA